MDDLDAPIKTGRSGLVVGILVLVGVGLLGVGVYLVLNKKMGNGKPGVKAGGDTGKWCKLRQDWKNKVVKLDGDLMVKIASEPDSKATRELLTQRNVICQDFAKKLRTMLQQEPTIYNAVSPIEEALVKEGKTRSNLLVKIQNKINADIPKAPDTEALDKLRKALDVKLVKEMKTKKAEYDAAVAAGLKALPDGCARMYRGTMTDQGTSGNPYTTWDEIEIKRTVASKMVVQRIKELEPAEAFNNTVRHDLMARYRKDLVACYKKTKKRNPKIPDKMGLKLRLDAKGKIKGVNFSWDNGMDEHILDCFANKATKWKLTGATADQSEASISLDFGRL